MHGSLINSISGSTESVPTVGMGATILMWSDRHAATVIGVSASGKTVTVQRDKATRTDSYGMSDSQTYTYAPDPDGSVQTFTLRKDGRWVQRGESLSGGTRLALGYRAEHYDYSF